MSKKLSYSITLALVIVSCGLTYLVNEYLHYRIAKTTNYTLDAISGSSSDESSDLEIDPLKNYKFIKPLNKPEPKKESVSFSQLKTNLNIYIESLKKSHKLISASVYLRYYGHGALMNVNPNEAYSPGSLLKVVNLLLYLKMEEDNPGLLGKKIVYTKPTYRIPIQTYNSKQIEAGKSYSIKELLKYMIVYSDNKATCLLVETMGSEVYLKMLNELPITIPQTKEGSLIMTASQYSEIFKLLYNSSYLSYENSEFALSLLNQCDFNIGLVNGIPSNISVVHKFGEAGVDGQHELHECGLVYMDYAPYLITIMTKGYKINDLPPIVSTISKMVYDDISKMEE